MTSRERVLASVEHREPDHLAVDLGSNPSAGISAGAHANLVAYLGLKDQRSLVCDVVQPSEELHATPSTSAGPWFLSRAARFQSDRSKGRGRREPDPHNTPMGERPLNRSST